MFVCKGCLCCGTKNITVLCCVYKYRIPIRSGNDAPIVYKIKYIPASNRSGWYPQVRIIISVGISDASKKI